MQKAYSERADLTRSGVSMLVQMYKLLFNFYNSRVNFMFLAFNLCQSSKL